MVFPAKRFCLVPSMEGVRWAFSCGTWLPSRAEWLLAVRSIQPEEKERIGQFVFARDAKAAMVLVFRAEKADIGGGGLGCGDPPSHRSLDLCALEQRWTALGEGGRRCPVSDLHKAWFLRSL